MASTADASIIQVVDTAEEALYVIQNTLPKAH